MSYYLFSEIMIYVSSQLLPRPYNYQNLEEMRTSLRHIGSIISQKGTPRATGPYIVALTGNGNVSQGALSLLQELPIKMITLDALEGLATSTGKICA